MASCSPFVFLLLALPLLCVGYHTSIPSSSPSAQPSSMPSTIPSAQGLTLLSKSAAAGASEHPIGSAERESVHSENPNQRSVPISVSMNKDSRFGIPFSAPSSSSSVPAARRSIQTIAVSFSTVQYGTGPNGTLASGDESTIAIDTSSLSANSQLVSVDCSLTTIEGYFLWDFLALSLSNPPQTAEISWGGYTEKMRLDNYQGNLGALSGEASAGSTKDSGTVNIAGDSTFCFSPNNMFMTLRNAFDDSDAPPGCEGPMMTVSGVLTLTVNTAASCSASSSGYDCATCGTRTIAPTNTAPTNSAEPSASPSAKPSASPSAAPTIAPSAKPSASPSAAPTIALMYDGTSTSTIGEVVLAYESAVEAGCCLCTEEAIAAYLLAVKDSTAETIKVEMISCYSTEARRASFTYSVAVTAASVASANAASTGIASSNLVANFNARLAASSLNTTVTSISTSTMVVTQADSQEAVGWIIVLIVVCIAVMSVVIGAVVWKLRSGAKPTDGDKSEESLEQQI